MTTTPDYWYDRSIRAWTLTWINANGDQVGHAEYFFGPDGKKQMLDWVATHVETGYVPGQLTD